MTSAHGYFEPWDYKYLYDKREKRGFFKEPEYDSSTIMGVISGNPNLSLFCYLTKLAGMDSLLNSSQCDCTVFVVADSYLNENDVLSFDKYQARKILQYHIIPKKVRINTIASRRLVKVDTSLNGQTLFFDTLDGVVKINDSVHILVPDVSKRNGYVNLVDSLLIPN
jgi:uncharacterized surface protein with fasciclin (FAS1) repeats